MVKNVSTPSKLKKNMPGAPAVCHQEAVHQDQKNANRHQAEEVKAHGGDAGKLFASLKAAH